MVKEKKSRNLLELVPHKLCESKVVEEGKVVILAPKFKSKLGKRLFEPIVKNKYVNIHLDELGSFVWKQMDGRQTVFEISEKLKEEFGEQVEPVYERIGKFLAIMRINRFIELREKKGTD